MRRTGSDIKPGEEAIQTLQQLGLKQYEAECFIGLSRLQTATASEIAEETAVPRTRVYESCRVLESIGLLKIYYSNPRKFEAVPEEEAVTKLEEMYDDRMERLRKSLALVNSK